jgi:ferredoxin
MHCLAAQHSALEQIQARVGTFWSRSPLNHLANDTDERAWDEPLFGVAAGNDPLFAKIKADIGPFYWLPEEAFALAFPQAPATADELSVLVWILPQTAATRADQKLATDFPAERWARSRDFGEKFNLALRRHLAETLTAAGHPSVAPELLPQFSRQTSERFGIASNWSERHTAHIAGLGTFGLSDGLITARGKAVRIGSLITRQRLPATPRTYTGHTDWCLWYAQGICGVCMRRCPVRTITPSGHDKNACFRYIRDVTTPYVQKTFGTDFTPCGLCQVDIPCEDRNPVVRRKSG